MRLRVAVWMVLSILWLPAASAQADKLRKQYVSQEPTTCIYAYGCRRMQSMAVGHARMFCQADGGVERGTRQGDYKCEQRGMNCVITGEIVCRGRVDPTWAPGAPGAENAKPAAPRQTCLDEACNRYLEDVPGHEEQGIHACREGAAMVGLSGMGSVIVCETLPAAVVESKLDESTQRGGMHVCPKGQLMRGVSEDRSTLLCARVEGRVRDERAQDESNQIGIQACEPREGIQTWLTGIDGARQGIRCGRLD